MAGIISMVGIISVAVLESWSDRKVRKQETSPPLRLVRVCKERVAGGIVVARGTFLGSYEVNSGAGGGGFAYF